MNVPKPITIIGGGLAGLSAGIALRHKNVPVGIVESGSYPRHRVCGEFISGRGVRTLEQLQLVRLIEQHGGRWARTAALFVGKQESPLFALPEPALCVSRHELDLLLASEFVRLGGKLKLNQRWKGSELPEGTVRATGRQVEPVVDGWRWIGLKAHASGVALSADLELHFLPNGYIGLCKLANDRVNVCGLIRSQTPLPQLAQTWRTLLQGETGSILEKRLARSEFDDQSFCSVAGLAFRTLATKEDVGTCLIGDALGMIPPVTGNGMSIAFETAEIAARHLAGYSSGNHPWTECQKAIRGDFAHMLNRRFHWAVCMHHLLFHAGARQIMFYALAQFPWCFRLLFGLTR